MNINEQLAFSMRNVFYTEEGDIIVPSCNRRLDNNNIFTRSLVVDISTDDIEIPIIARNHFEKIISYNLKYSSSPGNINKIVLPLYDSNSFLERKTFNGIIKYFFDNVLYSERLQKLSTSKGDIYYGGKGIIFDGNLNPLIMCALRIKKILDEHNEVVIGYYRPVCHINPIVFLESDKMLNRGIIKKLIPYYANYDVYLPSSYNGLIPMVTNKKVEILIDNFDNFFVKPVKPTISTFSNDDLNKCLVDNIEDLMVLI